MKSKPLQIILAIGILTIFSYSAGAQIPEAYHGKWRWNAPTIDLQYANGSMEIKKDSIYVFYDGMAEKFPSYNVYCKEDSVSWNYQFYGAEVLAAMNFESPDKAKGYGVNMLGKFPFDLFRNDSIKPATRDR